MKARQLILMALIGLAAASCQSEHHQKPMAMKNGNMDSANNMKSMKGMSMAGIQHSGMPDTTMNEKVILYYTCPMHRQIHEDHPGKCPICDMNLIPVKTTIEPSDSVQALTLSTREQLLANVKIDTARLGSTTGQRILTGTTIFSPQSQKTLSAWVSGWIEKMYVRNPGEKVVQGQKLYEIYSPDLLSAEKDYALAVHQKSLFEKANVPLGPTITALRQKLIRWGLSSEEIQQLSSKNLTGKVTVFSRSSGYLTQKLVNEGDYVKAGDAVLNLAKNNTIWVQAQLYDNDLSLIKNRKTVKVALAGNPREFISGKIVFNNPINQQNSRVHLVNIAIPNIQGNIQPGMLAYVYLEPANNTEEVVIPASAVVYGAQHNYVWIKNKSGKFERRRVKLGSPGKDGSIEIKNGLMPGALVVSSGVYLVNSEYVLEFGSGVNMSGMTMSDMKMNGRAK